MALLVAALPAAARAQGAGGSISGTMLDSTGAVLPGVLVTCKNVRTGLTVEATTNEVGIFRCPELPIGQYEVTGALDELVTLAYDDVSERLHPVARRSLHAHLIKLVADGRAEEIGESWKLRK